MLKPFLPVYGTSTSYSVRDGLLPVHPLVLHNLPATLRAATLTMWTYPTNPRCVRRAMLVSFKASARHVLTSRPSGPRHVTAHRICAASRRSLNSQVEEAHHEARQKGDRNPGGGEGTWGTIAGQEQVWGRVRGRLQTILPRLLRSPNLACKMRPRHAARVQRPRGQTPEATRPEP